jgi:CDP-glucose 4,6-dehydratase
MHVLVTGHTGFKGAWLTLLLRTAGHEVSGISLDPADGALFGRMDGQDLLTADLRLDIRDGPHLAEAVARIAPDVVVHLAAQPLVRVAYRDPQGTFGANVWGTINLLEAMRHVDSIRGALIVTTDKVYRNDGRSTGYVESDPLGGHDPYSASKAMADLATQSWRASYPGAPIAVARAGNVIGGGDVSPDRLMPDLINSFAAGTPAPIRNPEAVRPWQHVLDCLHGYVLLIEQMLNAGTEGEWNFGPSSESVFTVADVADATVRAWGDGAAWKMDDTDHPAEAVTLALDASKARSALGWRDRLTAEEAIAWTVSWERDVRAGRDPREIALRQIEDFRDR